MSIIRVFFKSASPLFVISLVCASAAMDLLDVDGDCIQFLIDPNGRLRESLGRKW